ncbi:hypothetical protein OG824_13760 [Streptomyces prunicolor]|uniref:hypothetical protein n=1 Tax=Streptomyces prunicolor TaxID=67348 RepID=UPI002258E337|nr:hypothetical protein [Streptomyces prunicolor]MCX5236267.1 hypothetical protein [Streptomyces prunicolor]
MADYMREYWDDMGLMYYWRNLDDGLVYSRPFDEEELAGIAKRQMLDKLGEEAKEAIVLNDGWIHANSAFLLVEAPTQDELLTQIRSLTEQASYQAGTAKRVIKVLAELTGREV